VTGHLEPPGAALRLRGPTPPAPTVMAKGHGQRKSLAAALVDLTRAVLRRFMVKKSRFHHVSKYRDPVGIDFNSVELFEPLSDVPIGPWKAANWTQPVLMSSCIPRTAPASTSTLARSLIDRAGPPT